jgi:ubiquinone/menaquinone biosynthesis C-methylase UbiE
MSFDVAAGAYDRFMGRYSVPLAPLFADFAGVGRDGRAVDVGCGPGALTHELVARLGARRVAAADPSEPFVAALREREPEVEAHVAPAEALPFADGGFDFALAQLVVHFMNDPVAGLSEMARVTHAGGVVSACVWDFGNGRAPLSLFWRAARELDPGAAGEGRRPGAREGQLEEYLAAAGLDAIASDQLTVTVEHASFDEWWEPYTLGVGPVGSYVAGLDADARTALRERCRELLPREPFAVSATALAARGRV